MNAPVSETRGRAYLFGPYRLDSAERLLLRAGRPVPLTPKVFDLLEILVTNHGHLVAKEALITALWPDSFVEEGGLTRCVSVLRKALGDDGAAGQQYIETVPKRGYRFIGSVSEAEIGGPISNGPGSSVSGGRSTARLSWRFIALAAATLVTIAALVYAVRPMPAADAHASMNPVHRQLTFTGKEGIPTLSPDGSRIAYVSYQSPDRQLIVREREGGQGVVMFRAPELGSLRWSPDGTALMFWARGDAKDGLYFAPMAGGAASKLGPGPAVAAWSPDGSTIAVGRPLVGQISIRNRQGIESSLISLADVTRWISDIDWSPVSGQLLVVTNDQQGRHTIWTVRSDGSQQRRLHVDTGEISTARWTRDGRALYYHRRIGQTSSVYKLQVPEREGDAAQPVPLVSGLETDGSFGISDDGKRLVYARAPYFSSLWTVDLPVSGTVKTRLLTDGTWRTERPRFSPDGKRIVFTVGYEDRSNLYTMPADGGTPRQLTFLDAFNAAGVWSNDGRSIAFVSTVGGRPEVWSVSAEGGSPGRLSPLPVSDSLELAWSPEANILFHQPGNRNFLALNPATGETGPFFGDGSAGWIFAPTFSPDGRRVAVGWSRRPNTGLWLIDLRDRTETLVTQEAGQPIGWSPDGAAIYVIDGKRSAYRDLAVDLGETMTQAAVRRVSLDGRIETVVELPFAEIGGVAISPDARQLVCSVYSTRSDVWLVEPFDPSVEYR